MASTAHERASCEACHVRVDDVRRWRQALHSASALPVHGMAARNANPLCAVLVDAHDARRACYAAHFAELVEHDLASVCHGAQSTHHTFAVAALAAHHRDAPPAGADTWTVAQALAHAAEHAAQALDEAREALACATTPNEVRFACLLALDASASVRDTVFCAYDAGNRLCTDTAAYNHARSTERERATAAVVLGGVHAALLEWRAAGAQPGAREAVIARAVALCACGVDVDMSLVAQQRVGE